MLRSTLYRGEVGDCRRGLLASEDLIEMTCDVKSKVHSFLQNAEEETEAQGRTMDYAG